jgi:hypothetical protein
MLDWDYWYTLGEVEKTDEETAFSCLEHSTEELRKITKNLI